MVNTNSRPFQLRVAAGSRGTTGQRSGGVGGEAVVPYRLAGRGGLVVQAMVGGTGRAFEGGGYTWKPWIIMRSVSS